MQVVPFGDIAFRENDGLVVLDELLCPWGELQVCDEDFRIVREAEFCERKANAWVESALLAQLYK